MTSFFLGSRYTLKMSAPLWCSVEMWVWSIGIAYSLFIFFFFFLLQKRHILEQLEQLEPRVILVCRGEGEGELTYKLVFLLSLASQE